jgi:hypothetical protein
VVADGLNGRTTAFDDYTGDCDRNGARTLPTALHAHAPLDLVIIMLGSNDMKPVIAGTAHAASKGMRRCCNWSGFTTGRSSRSRRRCSSWRRRRWSRLRILILRRCSRAACASRRCWPRSMPTWLMNGGRVFRRRFGGPVFAHRRRAPGRAQHPRLRPRSGAGGAVAAGTLNLEQLTKVKENKDFGRIECSHHQTNEEMIDVAYAPRTGGGISRTRRENA